MADTSRRAAADAESVLPLVESVSDGSGGERLPELTGDSRYIVVSGEVAVVTDVVEERST